MDTPPLTERVQDAAGDAVRVATDVTELTVQAAVDITQRIVEGQRAVLASLLGRR